MISQDLTMWEAYPLNVRCAWLEGKTKDGNFNANTASKDVVHANYILTDNVDSWLEGHGNHKCSEDVLDIHWVYRSDEFWPFFYSSDWNKTLKVVRERAALEDF